MELIDTHCHLDLPAFEHDRQQVISNAQQAGVAAFVIPAVNSTRWHQLIRLTQQHRHLYLALGLHPCFIKQHQPEDLIKLEKVIAENTAVAIGEIGLDYFASQLDKDQQRLYFSRQIDIAANFKLPVIIHARKSIDEIIQILKKAKFSHGGIMHAFNGSQQQADHLIKLGFKLGFGGMLTYERSTKLRKLAQQLPAESLVLETDAPDMTVASHQGQRNSPEYLPEVLQALAEVRQESADNLAQQTTHNAMDLLKLKQLK